MTARLVTLPLEREAPRTAANVKRVAGILGCTAAEVRRMVARGDLKGFTLGKRAIRVYLDSVTDYQGLRERQPSEPQTPIAKRRAVTSAAHEAARRELQKNGWL